jgi:phosphopantothenoylcysteine decarboxylase/phosphopantothenate--cysteine ligase
VVILVAAASDFSIKNAKKTKVKSSLKKFTLTLVQTPKMIDLVKKIQKNVFLVGFKAETNVSKKALELSARKKLKKSHADMIVANDIGTRYQKNQDYNDVLIVDSKKTISSGWKKKEQIAKLIRKEIENHLK